MKSVLLAALACCLPLVAAAAELQSIKVSRSDGVYHVRSEVLFEASRQSLYEVFADWDLSTQFSSIVVESRNEAADENGRPQFYSRLEACIILFCRSFERNGYIELQPFTSIQSVAYPDSSDFHIAEESWLLSDVKGATKVIYELSAKPKFWIPPVIGPFIIKRKLEKSTIDALQRMESIAQAKMLVDE